VLRREALWVEIILEVFAAFAKVEARVEVILL
jgi:hypothetical protein